MLTCASCFIWFTLDKSNLLFSSRYISTMCSGKSEHFGETGPSVNFVDSRANVLLRWAPLPLVLLQPRMLVEPGLESILPMTPRACLRSRYCSRFCSLTNELVSSSVYTGATPKSINRQSQSFFVQLKKSIPCDINLIVEHRKFLYFS